MNGFLPKLTMYRFLLLGCWGLFLTACSDPTPHTNTVKLNEANASAAERLNQAFDSVTANHEFMGNVALLHKGELLFSRATGFANISTEQSADMGTKYRLGSVSKTYTAVMVFKAIAEGKLTLEQRVDAFFPELENAAKIRVADLLQHRSGIASYTKDPRFFKYHTMPQTRQQMLQMIFSYQSDFEPGSSAEYSNSNYFLLACILEKLHGKPLEQILQEQIVMPLSLTSTYLGNQVTPEQNESYSYRFEAGWQLLPQTDMSVTLGAGDVVSTATEAALFLDALFNDRLVSAQHLATMQAIKDGFGMGIMRYDLAGRVGFGHRGTLDGYRATAIHFPDDKVTLVVTSNGENDNINLVYEALLKAFFNDAILAVAADELDRYVGTYVSNTEKSDKVVFIRDGNQLVHVIQNEFKEALTYKGERQFLFEQMYGPAILFSFSENGAELLMEQDKFRGRFTKE
ncbi:serine hydrolase domain-containing protein [Bowmanella yangjiangensis]|uniref:Beta-lactamase family protein n=1 Tax=Bowmanella yangjiangensis TaxID=2811230 RepID=A0ABS3CN70_9ALTE|nr:serine hydrolase domain-containing protein [Bowmanella yangjiangensis]MBN7818563.1 beta-lactamase family protein [Bowmanella yangjiangensis]